MKWKKVEGAGDMIDARGSGGGSGRAVGVGAGGLGIGAVVVLLLFQALTGTKFDIPTELNSAGAQADSSPLTSSCAATASRPGMPSAARCLLKLAIKSLSLPAQASTQL